MSTRNIELPFDGVDSLGAAVREHWFAYLLFVPTLLFLVFVLWIPFLQGIYMSFYEWPFVGEKQFVGLGNYRYLLTWEFFPQIMKATLLFSLSTVAQLALAIAATQAVYHQKRFQNVVSGSMLIPYTMPPVVIGTIWIYLLEPTYGPIFKLLTNTGILSAPIYWSTHGDTALAVITFVTAWTFWPFMFLIILASRQSIPDSYYDCARIYGAGKLQSFWRITLPQLKSAILVAVSIRIVWNLAKVSQPYQMTKGGPGHATSILAVQLYKFANEQGNMGLAFATGIVLLLLTVGLVFVFIREFERESTQR